MSRPPPPPPPLPPQKVSVFVAPLKTTTQSIESELQSKILKTEEKSEDYVTSLFGFELDDHAANSSFTICSICKNEVKNQQAHSNFHSTQVFPWLFLGSKENSSNISEIRYCGVSCIVNCTSEISNSFTNELNYYTFPIGGGSANAEMLVDASYLLESLRVENKIVLVHCVLGVNRAAGLVIYYLMAFSGMPLRDAYIFLKSKRTIIRLKRYILEELVELEKSLYGFNSLDIYELCENEND